MATEVLIDETKYSLEKLDTGSIRVSFATPQTTLYVGSGSDGVHSYEVHPCQRRQYEFWNGYLPADQRATHDEIEKAQKPWWSYTGGERSKPNV